VAFDLARRLLAGIGHNLGVGSANTFVFLLDMNRVFEDYVHAVLEAHFKVAVEKQHKVGRLFEINKGGIDQIADYSWCTGQVFWIGDAKYKHLTKGQQRALRFCDLGAEDKVVDDASLLAGSVLSPDDVRQLTVYAELVQRSWQPVSPPHLMLLYPFIGSSCDCIPDSAVAWNGSTFTLTPVLVRELEFIGDAIQLPVSDPAGALFS
jgi:hypothetical protein